MNGGGLGKRIPFSGQGTRYTSLEGFRKIRMAIRNTVKGVSFLRNCGVMSIAEYNRVI